MSMVIDRLRDLAGNLATLETTLNPENDKTLLDTLAGTDGWMAFYRGMRPSSNMDDAKRLHAMLNAPDDIAADTPAQLCAALCAWKAKQLAVATLAAA